MLRQFAKPGSIVAVVSDSYDIYTAIREHWGKTLRDEVIASGGTLVVRPDSGDPVEVVNQCLVLLDEAFGHTVNRKGYKVLNHVRVIQGDGINERERRDLHVRKARRERGLCHRQRGLRHGWRAPAAVQP